MITKSKFLTGLECPRCYWKLVNNIDKEDVSLQTKQAINTKQSINNMVKNIFDNYIDLTGIDFNSNIEIIKEEINNKKAIINASVIANSLCSKIDVLYPNEDGTLDIYLIASSNIVKEKNINGLAFQKYILELLDILINNCYVIHLNGNYEKVGQLDLEQLFVKEDVTINVNEFYNEIPAVIESLLEIKGLKAEPEIIAEKYMFKDYPCEFGSECWSKLPEYNVTELYRLGKKKAITLMKNGIFKIKDVPDDKLNSNQKIQKETIETLSTHIDKKGINDFLINLKYPLYYFDFETFSEPIPRFDNTKPYSQIPFQYSLHVQQEDGAVDHFEFLNCTKDDPRKLILESMKNQLGNSGSVIVFNQTFEKTRLKELSELYPEYKEWVNSIIDRMVDLLIPFSKFYYYNPSQKGSCSIKKVLPAITGMSYEELEIGNGEEAANLYYQATFKEIYTDDEKNKIYKNLLKYCELDTKGMVLIVDELKNIV